MEGGKAEARWLEDNDKPFSWETLASQTRTAAVDIESSGCVKGKLVAVPVAWIRCVHTRCFQGSQPKDRVVHLKCRRGLQEEQFGDGRQEEVTRHWASFKCDAYCTYKGDVM